jgi:DNA polymerase III delta subunit
MERFITNNVEDSSIFIFNCEEKKIPKSLKLMCTVIPNFSIDSARKIIKDILKIHNAQFFDDITMKYFLDLVPKNYFSINSELLKLINFNPIITKENIDKLIFSNEQADIFNFITNLIINDKNKCLSIFENLLSQKYQVTDILVAICPNLLTLKILNSALEKRINSFQIQNSLNIPL